MSRKFFAGLVLFVGTVGVMGCAGLEPLEVREKTLGKAVPVISQSFASQQLRPGETWKVYLVASDPDGNMKNILCTIHQPGVGTYPVSINRIREENLKELSGFIYLITSSLQHLDGVNLALTVQIQDMAGHDSQPVVFPLSLNNTYQQELPPEGIFKEVDLGPIMIELHTVGKESPGPSFRRRH